MSLLTLLYQERPEGRPGVAIPNSRGGGPMMLSRPFANRGRPSRNRRRRPRR